MSVVMKRTALKAFVLQVKEREMRVCDCATLQEMLVHTGEAAGFCEGDRICIEYSGNHLKGAFPQIRERQICRITRF